MTLKCFEIDPSLPQHAIWDRVNGFKHWKGVFESNEGGIGTFAEGYKIFGMNRNEADTGFTFREYLPGAKQVFLIGEFNNWENKTPLKNEGFGRWSVELPDKASGEYMVPHKTKYKIRLESNDVLALLSPMHGCTDTPTPRPLQLELRSGTQCVLGPPEFAPRAMGVRSLAVVSVLLGRAASVLHGRAASDATQVLSLTQDFEQLNAHQGDVRALNYVGIGGDIVSGGQDSLVKRWAASDLSPLQPSKLVTYIIYDTAAAPDGSIIATSEGGWNGNAGSDTLRIWSGDLSPWNSTRPAVGYVYSVAVSPVQPSLNKWRVAASGFAGDIAIYSFDVSTSALELEATIATGTKRTFTLAFSPDGELLASGSQKGQVQLWQMSTLELVASLRHSAKFDFSVEFSPDGSRLASGTDKGLLKLWDLATFEEIFSVNVGIGGVYSLSFSASGNEVAVAGNSAIRIFAAANGAILAEELSAHNGRVLDVAFEPQPLAASTRLVSGGRDGAIRLWSLGSGGLP